MKRIVGWAVVLVLVLVVGSLASQLGPLRNIFDTLFNRQTTVATGDVVLKSLQEQQKLVVSSGSFQVPVVVCNGTPDAYDLRDDADKAGKTPAQRLLEACDGLFEAKATVLASADVDAFIDLSRLEADDITIAGDRVSVSLPAIELAEPRVDAENGISVIGKDGAVPLPIVGGELPEDYQARAAGAAKEEIAGLAGDSGLYALGERSAKSLFEGLLGALGFTDVEILVQDAPTESR